MTEMTTPEGQLLDELREQYAQSELDHDRNPTRAGFLGWLAAQHQALLGKVRKIEALADRYAQDGRDVLSRGEVLKSDVADTIRSLLAD